MYSAYFQYYHSEISISQATSLGPRPRDEVKPVLNQGSNTGGNRSSGMQSSQYPLLLNQIPLRDEPQSMVPNVNHSRPPSIQSATRYNRIPIASLLNEKNEFQFSPPDSPHVINRRTQDDGQNQAGSASLPPVPNFIGGASSTVSPNATTTQNSLRRHLCRICAKGFRQKAGVKQHVKAVHRKIKDKACNYPGCVKVYSTVGDLTRHKKSVHLGRRPFVCTCNRRFTKRTSLMRHIDDKDCGPPTDPEHL